MAYIASEWIPRVGGASILKQESNEIHHECEVVAKEIDQVGKVTAIESRKNSSDPLPPVAPVEIVREAHCENEDFYCPVSREPMPEQSKKEMSLCRIFANLALGLLGVWLYFELAAILQMVLSYSGWRLYIASIVFLIPVIVIIWSVLFVLRRIMSLPRFEQIRCSRHDGTGLLRQRLVDGYLKHIKLSTYIDSCKFGDVETVTKMYNGLVEKYKISSDMAWLDEFARFQHCQEERAKAIVRDYCKLVGLKTAMCPWRIIDVVCVLVNTTLMVSRIATVFNRRVSSVAASQMVIRWCFNLYVSGELGDALEKTSVSVGQSAADAVKDADLFSGGSVGDFVANSAPVLSKWAGKAAEGATNAYLAYRLGLIAIEKFKAVDFEK